MAFSLDDRKCRRGGEDGTDKDIAVIRDRKETRVVRDATTMTM